MKRRTFVSGSAALAAAGFASTTASAASIKPYSWDLNPPTDTRENFIAWGKARGEDPVFLGQRWDRFQALVKNKDIWGAATIRAFLLTPREEFSAINPAIHKRAYEHAFLDIGYGVTMSGPHVQGRMTNVIDVKRGEKVLEIGTGSGVQSAYIANLTENAYTIEIITPLGGPHPRPLRQADREGLHRVQAHQDQGGRRLLRLGRGGALRQDHRDLRHRPRAAAAPAAAQGRRPDGDPGRPAGRAARAQGHQDPRRRRLDHHDAARTSTAARSCRSCPSPRSKATRSSARTTADARMR